MSLSFEQYLHNLLAEADEASFEVFHRIWKQKSKVDSEGYSTTQPLYWAAEEYKNRATEMRPSKGH